MTNETQLTYAQVMEKLPAIVAECLAIEAEDVTPEMVFREESIEYLDLSFRCEKAFGIKAPFRLLLGSKDQLTLDSEGYFTETSLQLIRDTYPFLAKKFDADGRTRLQLPTLLDYFTVEIIAQFILHAAAERRASSQAA